MARLTGTRALAAAARVDVALLSRDRQPLHPDVDRGLSWQRGVQLHVYRIIGAPRAADEHRWATIARSRNRARRLGDSPWLMFVDDDVVLGPDCILRLIQGLKQRPQYAALAADYLCQSPLGGPAPHVSMGATLFRRAALERIKFRWEANRCECQCCCDDLRRMGLQIGYLRSASARHLGPEEKHTLVAARPRKPAVNRIVPQPQRLIDAAPRVLAAFDFRHCEKFQQRFLRSLRAAGNREQVMAVGYGLSADQQKQLSNTPRVRLVSLADNGISPARRRLHDFQRILRALPPETPVAYWDAGDVVFQGSLEPLWRQVRAEPRKILAVREPLSFPENGAVAEWALSIAHPRRRREAFELLARRPFLNSGFAAGTARALLGYFRYADRLRNGGGLAGTRDWGDQIALNLFCYANPERWIEAEEGWNFCLFGRPRSEIEVERDGRVVCRRKRPVYAVHGNAQTLRWLVGMRKS